MDMPDRLGNTMIWVERNRNKPNPIKPMYVYIIRLGMYIKIGIARNVRQRISAIQIGSPYEIVLLRCWQTMNAREEEKWLHNRLDQYHHRGEWFRLPDHVLRGIIKASSGRFPEPGTDSDIAVPTGANLPRLGPGSSSVNASGHGPGPVRPSAASDGTEGPGKKQG